MSRVLYVELREGNAVETLRSLLLEQRLLPGFAGGEVLVSPAQPGLALLQSRWRESVPVVRVPGARVWSFEVVESVHPAV